jgi:hypothetical protein
MGRLFLVSLPATTGDIIYRCKHCDTHLAYATDIISKVPIDETPLSLFLLHRSHRTYHLSSSPDYIYK